MNITRTALSNSKWKEKKYTVERHICYKQTQGEMHGGIYNMYLTCFLSKNHLRTNGTDTKVIFIQHVKFTAVCVLM